MYSMIAAAVRRVAAAARRRRLARRAARRSLRSPLVVECRLSLVPTERVPAPCAACVRVPRF
eukprot:1134200-Prymnesium_polylepis.1